MAVRDQPRSRRGAPGPGPGASCRRGFSGGRSSGPGHRRRMAPLVAGALPFPACLIGFFGGDSLWAHAWTDGLDVRPDGLWPKFDVDTMLACLDGVARPYWDEWAAIRCPTVIVRAERGLSQETASHMQELLPNSRVVDVRGARHDVHLERPDQWREVLSRFLAEVARD